MKMFIMVLGLFYTAHGFSQSLNHRYAFRVGGENFSFSRKIVPGSDGSVYGLFNPLPFGSDTSDFDPGAGSAVFNGITQAGSVVVKYDPDGNFEWLRDIATATSLSIFEEGLDLAIDSRDHVFVFGLFKDSLDFDPGAGQKILSTKNPGSFEFNQAAYVSEYDSEGNFVNAFAITGLSKNNDAFIQPELIRFGGDGRIYLCGKVLGNADFDPGPEIATTPQGVVTLGGTVFIAGYNSDGSFHKVHFIGTKNTLSSGGGIQTRDFLVSIQGDIFLAGILGKGGDRDYDPGPLNLALNAQGADDGILLKFSADGSYEWGGVFGSGNFFLNEADMPVAVQQDATGNIYLCGRSQDGFDADLNPADEVIALLGRGGDYIIKYNSEGKVIWSKIFTNCQGSGVNEGQIYDLKYQGGKLFACGTYTCENDFNPEPDLSFVKPHQAGNDFYILACDTSGNLIGVNTFSGPGNEVASHILVKPEGEITLLGALRKLIIQGNGTVVFPEIDFDPGIGVNRLKGYSENSGSWFIARYAGVPEAVGPAPGFNRTGFKVLRASNGIIEIKPEAPISGNLMVQIHDISGRLLKQIQVPNHPAEETILLEQIPPGLMIVRLHGNYIATGMVLMAE